MGKLGRGGDRAYFNCLTTGTNYSVPQTTCWINRSLLLSGEEGGEGLRLTAIHLGFELHECPLVIMTILLIALHAVARSSKMNDLLYAGGGQQYITTSIKPKTF